MSITAQNIATRVTTILQDNDSTVRRWPDPEILYWINDGQREIVRLKPDANPVTESVLLSAGTKQSVPSSGVGLLSVVRNMGTDGSTAGIPVDWIDIKSLNDMRPGWHSETQVSVITLFTYDLRNPLIWYACPPADGTTYVEIVYPKIPDDIASLENAIKISGIYANALVDYAVYRCLLKDSDYAANKGLAEASYQSFLRTLGLQDKRESIDSPNARPFQKTGVVQKGSSS